jgi:hypothetical protein
MQDKLNKPFRLILAILILMSGILVVSAQHRYVVSRHMAFKRGEASTKAVGTIPTRMVGHEYVFRARKGQTLKVDLVSNSKDVSFYIMTPDGNMVEEEIALRSWTGELPVTGNYRLVINADSDRPARYRLEVQIATDI